MLEAAIQKGDLGQGGYEAWILLGEVRSMDEREDASMRALNEGVKRAVDANAAGEGMLVSVGLLLGFNLWINYSLIPNTVSSNIFHERKLRTGLSYDAPALAARPFPRVPNSRGRVGLAHRFILELARESYGDVHRPRARATRKRKDGSRCTDWFGRSVLHQR